MSTSTRLMPLEKKTQIVWQFGFLVLFFWMTGFGIGVPLLGHWSWGIFHEFNYSETQYSWQAFIGSQIIVISLPLSVFCLLLFISSVARANWLLRSKVISLASTVFACFALW